MNAARFIAEVSSNHNGDLDRCLRFVDAAADMGCWGVKFQLFRVRELFAPEILARSEMHRAREAWELPEAYLEPLSARARGRGLAFGLTPFHLAGVALAAPMVDFFKVASYELLCVELIEACAGTGKPLILSTGMATLPEVRAAVDAARRGGGRDLTLLHCVSSYPVAAEHCNLASIKTLRDAFDCEVGWSDHSVSAGVVRRAVNHWGASVVEFHLDLDGQGEEFSAGHCWLPSQMAFDPSGEGDPRADGTGEKMPMPSELADREWRADPTDGLRPMLSVRAEWETR
ncbi:MAG: sialic acid synthase SpsE [Rhodothermales bacterium]|jgi:sialic acid synthase SpsE